MDTQSPRHTGDTGTVVCTRYTPQNLSSQDRHKRTHAWGTQKGAVQAGGGVLRPIPQHGEQSVQRGLGDNLLHELVTSVPQPPPAYPSHTGTDSVAPRILPGTGTFKQQPHCREHPAPTGSPLTVHQAAAASLLHQVLLLQTGPGPGGGGTVPPAEVRKAQLSPAHEKAGPRLQSRTAFAVCPQTRSLQNLSEPPACSRTAGPW